ncbi:MAG: TetR/AcrR family transcriptional regulator [Mucilaginibacter sp.]|nr:TetR/AcrR family transcriptional regulator [Mucilaginibacter sp.]
MEKDKIDKKEHILDVAERVFSELGFDGASTRTISGEAGVNMAMLNYYFGSKEGLFLAVFNRKISSFKNLLQNIGSDDTTTSWAKMEKYIDLYVQRVVNNNCFQKMLYQELAMQRRGDLADQISTILMGNVLELKKIIRDGIDNGEFNQDVDIEMIIATIYGTKNFIVNAPQLTTAMLGFDIQDEKTLEEVVKPRIEAYMKKLLRAYLVKEHDNTNK